MNIIAIIVIDIIIGIIIKGKGTVPQAHVGTCYVSSALKHEESHTAVG